MDCACGDSKLTKQPLSENELWSTGRSEASFCGMVMASLVAALRQMKGWCVFFVGEVV